MDRKILIVEDEAKLREVLCDYFKSKGEKPDEAGNGVQALSLLEETEYDAVLLDIMMPGLDGLSVCRAVRRTNDVPIIFLTALSDEDDKLLGYELGADDYVTKPFTMSVLYAKTMALIKRNRRNVLAGDRMEAGGVTVELSTRRVWAGKKEIILTPTRGSRMSGPTPTLSRWNRRNSSPQIWRPRSRANTIPASTAAFFAGSRSPGQRTSVC